MATSSDYDYPIDVNNIRILQCLPVHQSDVTCCDFAIGNDFIYVITGSSDKLVRIWEWIIGDGFVETSFSPLSSHKYGVTSLQVSPQSSMLITGSIDGVAFLWRIKTGEKIYAFVQDNGDPIRVCRFSPNSVMVVTAGDNGAVCIWDLIHRSLIRTITQHEGIVQAISFTSDSLYLLTSCTLGVMNFWSVDSLCDTTIEESLPLITIGDAHDLGVLSCDFSPIVTIQEDNIQKRMYSLATSGNDHCIKIWKITAEVLPKQLNAFSEINFELTDFLDGHSSAITYVKYNIDGNYIASTSLDRTCRVWGLNENRDVAVLEGHSRYVNCCGFSQNNIFLATGSNDKSIIIWDLTGCTTFDSEFTNTLQLLNFKANLQENAVAKLGENHDNDVILLQQIENVHSISINCCDINRNDLTLVTASSDKTIKLFKFNSDENLYEEVEYSPLCEHTYSVNYVEFSKTNEYLVSCSLDGSAIIWNYLTGEQIFKPTFADEVCGIRTCRLSYDCKILVTAGDDERATVFDLENMESLAILEGHSDAITSIALTKNTKLLATVCSAGDLRLWSLESLSDSVETEPICVQLEAHDLGVQNCDFSENEMPIPNVNYTESQYYLLATCGNDSMVKLWKIKLPIIDESILDYGNVEVIEWRCLIGHGGNVNFVRFSPHNSDIVCSVATDRQARIWSPYSSVCLYTLDHESMLTSCAFSSDCSMIAISCLNKSIWVWKLPQKLVFQNILMNRIKNNKKSILNWTTNEVVLWIRSIDLGNLADTIIECNINGEILLNTDEDELSNTLNLDEDSKQIFLPQLSKLKSKQNIMDEKVSIPHEFLCPITQEVMRNPMKCTDGFTYEQSAIEEWFSSGKNTSPMTNEELEDMELTPNYELLIGIEAFINSN